MLKRKQAVPPDETNGETNEKSTPVGTVFDYLEIIVFSVCAVLVIFTLVGRLCRVDGDSMIDTLHDGELLVITSIGEIERGDVVVFHQTANDEGDQYNEPLVKRVVGVGGDTVRINYAENKVYLNGEELDESYAHLLERRFTETGGTYIEIGDLGYKSYYDYGFLTPGVEFEVTVPEGSYFVMGDNRNYSADSRVSEIGCVDGRRMLGRVVLRVRPFTTDFD